ncbi:substrate-binding domain-containing protein, partial [Streptomonospora nanhaiensis]
AAAAVDRDAARDTARAALRREHAAGRAVTAVVCDDDILAVGAYKAAQAEGLAVPGDLSVTGVDNVDLAQALTPELTTVDLPGETLGAMGMRRLLAAVDGADQAAEVVRLPARLLIRGSTAPPPSRSSG